MKTISQTFTICLLALSTTIVQASNAYGRSNQFPPLSRNQQVPIVRNSLLRTQQVTSPTPSSTTPVTIRLSTPSPASLQQAAHTQEYVNNLITSTQLLAIKNDEYKTQITTLTEDNKALKEINQTLLYATKLKQDQLNHGNNRLIILEQTTNKQDVVIGEQRNEIILLQAQIAHLTMRRSSTAIQNNNAK